MGLGTRLKYSLIGIRLLWSFLVPIIFVFIAINTWALFGHPDTNPLFVFIFGSGSILAAVIAFFISFPLDILNLRGGIGKEGKTFSFFFTNNVAKFRLLSKNPFFRYGTLILFALLTGASVAGSGGLIQGWPVPTPFIAEKMSAGLSDAEKFVHQSFTPAFVEDYLFLQLSNVFLAVFAAIFWVLHKFGVMKKYIDIKKAPLLFILFAFIACVMASTGYGAAVAGFASTHELAQGDNPLFYASAIAFGTLNLMAYQMTGLFIPLAHFINNFLFSFQLAVGLTVGGTVVGQIILARRLKRGDPV